MKLKKLVIAAAAVTLLATGVQAQVYGPVAGDWELTLEGRGANDRRFENGAFGLSGSLGYFMTDNWEVAVRQEVAYTDFGGSSRWNAITLAALDYHFNLDRWRPFIGVAFGGIYGDDVKNSFLAGPELGVKYYVKPKTFIQAKMDYQWIFRRARDIDNRFDDGRFGYSVGIGFNF
jgi:hypothetical protein